MKKSELGKIGEKLAVEHLIGLNYQILAQNWRYSRHEIDIIAKEGNVLVFIEVKTRSDDYFGPPDEFVTEQQQNHIWQAAQSFMEEIEYEWEIRFDIISVLQKAGHDVKIQHFKDAFWPDWD